MDKNTYHVYQIMERLKKGTSKREISQKAELSTKDFEKAWKSLKGMKRIVTLRRKTFALNGTILSAILSTSGRLAS